MEYRQSVVYSLPGLALARLSLKSPARLLAGPEFLE